MKSAAEWLDYCAGEMENAGLFFGHGTDNARDEAAWMLLHVLAMPLDGSFEQWDQTLTASEERALTDLLHSRVETRQPLAYLTGTARFCDMDFVVTPDVLVPRSPLAELIQNGFSPWLRLEPGDRVLDMCTGGACIAIAIARHLPETRVDAVDISTGALEVAARNVERHHVGDNVTLVHSDLFDEVVEERYRLIISNPPYVSEDLFAQLPAEYLAEPGGGLVSGHDGLDIVLRILDAAPSFLAEDGILIVEVGESAPALAGLLPRAPFLWLEFEHGGDGVFLLEYDQLVACQADVHKALEQRNDVR